MQIEIIDGKLYQWDTGRKVRLTPDADESITEVHFGCQCDQEALVVAPEIGEEIAVCIPPEPLQKSGWLQVYVMTATDTPGKRTAYHAAEPIFARPKPVDYVFTPTERLTWESLDKRVTALELGGGGSGSALIVSATIKDTTWAPDHTSQEIYEAYSAGRCVYLKLPLIGVLAHLIFSTSEQATFQYVENIWSSPYRVTVGLFSIKGDVMESSGNSGEPFIGATEDSNGDFGYVPAPTAGQQDMVLHGDGTWREVQASGGEKEWKYEKYITITEDTAGFTLDAYDDGTPFDFTEIEIHVALKNAGTSGVWGEVRAEHDGVNHNGIAGSQLALGGSNSSVSVNVGVGVYYMCILKGYIDSELGVYAQLARGGATTYLNASSALNTGLFLNVPNYSYSNTAHLNNWGVKPTRFTRVASGMTIGANSTIIVRGR